MKKSDIVVSTRVRLARNLKDYPFPNRIKDEKIFKEISDKVKNSLTSKTDMRANGIGQLCETERSRLVERHIISPDFAKNPYGTLIATPDNKISVMVNEEDHIRIQAITEGFDVSKVLLAASEAERILCESLMLAYDDEFGFLTACPTNVGTGMRISAMLHLPSLARRGALSDLCANLSRMGYAVRGVYGEGSNSKGYLYQISNEITLGSTKEEISKDFKKVIEKICDSEISSRKADEKRFGISLEDKVMRSVGILKYCRSISSKEATELLSNAAEGAVSSLIRIDPKNIYDAYWEVSPACLETGKGSSSDRDIRRAKFLNELFKEV